MNAPDPAQLAALHRACFTIPAPWSDTNFALFLADRTCHLIQRHHDGRLTGFALFRHVLDEAELLTLAVDPAFRRRGIARALICCGTAGLAHASCCFLEVDAQNSAAKALYLTLGFEQIGLRRGYYRQPDGLLRDALVMRAGLPLTAGCAPCRG